MSIYIALVRGVNVGGRNMIKMSDLKQLFENMGFNRVQTYINSGNVLFESQEGEAALLERIEHGIEMEFGLSIKVVLRTDNELRDVMDACPYKENVDPDGKNVNIGFLAGPPAQEAIERLRPYQGVDEFQVIGREIHLLFHQRQNESKLANNLHKLGTCTVRNWNTIRKLASLAGSMDG
ncbi:MAG: DUF1697 domain-containing protein [Alicyclobacillus sp.]|nr:DUF1697 domain-containing protein [Alicyclobacillus sp.]